MAFQHGVPDSDIWAQAFYRSDFEHSQTMLRMINTVCSKKRGQLEARVRVQGQAMMALRSSMTDVELFDHVQERRRDLVGFFKPRKLHTAVAGRGGTTTVRSRQLAQALFELALRFPCHSLQARKAAELHPALKEEYVNMQTSRLSFPRATWKAHCAPGDHMLRLGTTSPHQSHPH